MRDQNLKTKQQGVFSIEFAIIAVFFSLLLVFSGDVIIKLSVKGKLDRLSYSLVNIIKERKQLYKNNTTITQSQTDAIYDIAKNSLKRTMSNFEENNLSILVEGQTYTSVEKDDKTTDYQANILQAFSKGTPDCKVTQSLDKLAKSTKLAVVSVQDRKLPLYRVTLCYETNDWIGSKLKTSFTTVSSSSVIVGRL